MESDQVENAQPKESKNSARNIAVILLAGALSMFFAEVMAGSSNTWFLDPFGWLLTYVLYMGHVLFYLNIAVRAGRTKLIHLYLFGMLFALYEAPITQVLWSGYMDSSEPPKIMFAGIALMEFLILVFFWHPIMSFIIPVIMFEVLVIDNARRSGIMDRADLEALILPGHYDILVKLKRKKAAFFTLLFLIGVNQITAVGLNIAIAETAYIGSMILIYLFYSWAQKKGKKLNRLPGIGDLILSDSGFKKFVVFLILYVYMGGSAFISHMLPGRFPSSMLPYISIIVVVLIIVLLIKMSPRNVGVVAETEPAASPEGINTEELFGAKDLWVLFGLLILAEIVFGLLGSISMVLMPLLYFVLMISGVVLFIKLLLNIKKA